LGGVSLLFFPFLFTLLLCCACCLRSELGLFLVVLFALGFGLGLLSQAIDLVGFTSKSSMAFWLWPKAESSCSASELPLFVEYEAHGFPGRTHTPGYTLRVPLSMPLLPGIICTTWQ
jgi:hypothetical protein